MKKEAFIAFLAGAALGGIAALLLAPESGEKTRRRIRRFVEDEKDKLMDMVDTVKEKYEDIEHQVQEKYGDIEQKVQRVKKCIKEE